MQKASIAITCNLRENSLSDGDTESNRAAKPEARSPGLYRKKWLKVQTDLKLRPELH